MYATIRRYDGVTNASEAIRRVNEGFIQIISEIPGFAAYYFVDAGGGVLVVETGAGVAGSQAITGHAIVCEGDRRGCGAVIDFVDAGGGVMISVSVFQDRASAEESNARASDYVRENLVSVLPNPPQISAGEVVAHTAK